LFLVTAPEPLPDKSFRLRFALKAQMRLQFGKIDGRESAILPVYPPPSIPYRTPCQGAGTSTCLTLRSEFLNAESCGVVCLCLCQREAECNARANDSPVPLETIAAAAKTEQLQILTVAANDA
jgi:hypothetical protein